MCPLPKRLYARRSNYNFISKTLSSNSSKMYFCLIPIVNEFVSGSLRSLILCIICFVFYKLLIKVEQDILTPHWTQLSISSAIQLSAYWPCTATGWTCWSNNLIMLKFYFTRFALWSVLLLVDNIIIKYNGSVSKWLL